MLLKIKEGEQNQLLLLQKSEQIGNSNQSENDQLSQALKKIALLEQNARHHEMVNNELKTNQSQMAGGMSKMYQMSEQHENEKNEIMSKCVKFEHALTKMSTHTSSSSTAPAYPKYIDPALEENRRKTRERNKRTALEQIQAEIKDNFRPSKPVKTLSECATYPEWRECVSRWNLMCGGAHTRQLILELID